MNTEDAKSKEEAKQLFEATYIYPALALGPLDVHRFEDKSEAHILSMYKGLLYLCVYSAENNFPELLDKLQADYNILRTYYEKRFLKKLQCIK